MAVIWVLISVLCGFGALIQVGAYLDLIMDLYFDTIENKKEFKIRLIPIYGVILPIIKKYRELE